MTEPETQAYIQGVREGGVLVFANDSDEQVEKFAEIMNRQQAASVDEFAGTERDISESPHECTLPIGADSAQAEECAMPAAAPACLCGSHPIGQMQGQGDKHGSCSCRCRILSGYLGVASTQKKHQV